MFIIVFLLFFLNKLHIIFINKTLSMSKYLNALTKLLTTLGLNQEAREIFMKVFVSNGLTVSKVSERSGIDRNKCYRIIEEIESMGLINQIADKKVSTYIAVSPKKLKKILTNSIQEQIDVASEFNTYIEELENINKKQQGVTDYKFVNKKQSYVVLKDILFNHSYKAIFNPKIVFQNYPELLREWKAYQKSSQFKIKELIPMSDGIDFYNEALPHMNENYRLKMMPEQSKFLGDMILFGGKIYISSQNNNANIIIEDIDLYESFESMFDLIWTNC